MKKVLVPSALLMGLVGNSFAALPSEVTTAITGAQTDMLALYGALTTAGAALFVAGLIYRRFKLR